MKFICDHVINFNCKFVLLLTDRTEKRMCKEINRSEESNQNMDISGDSDLYDAIKINKQK